MLFNTNGVDTTDFSLKYARESSGLIWNGIECITLKNVDVKPNKVKFIDVSENQNEFCDFIFLFVFDCNAICPLCESRFFCIFSFFQCEYFMCFELSKKKRENEYGKVSAMESKNMRGIIFKKVSLSFVVLVGQWAGCWGQKRLQTRRR